MKTINQLDLFGEQVSPSIAIEESAKYVGVSTATIRNWIKTGYLVQTERGMVTLESLNRFMLDISGKEKLVQRANKSRKDSHNHEQVVAHILKKLECDNAFKSLGVKYEKSLSESYRNKEGIYYTPKWIVDDLLKEYGSIEKNTSFLDPCCGSGNFIVRALDLGFMPQNIYGYDVDPVAVEITKKRIYDKTGFNSQNISVVNFLDLVISKKKIKFDYIFTNPPWGKKIEKEERKIISQLLNVSSSLDTCAIFFQACIKMLNDRGSLGFILPDAFFNISSYEGVRASALNHQIERLIDYEKPFKNLVAKAQGIVLSKNYPACKVVECQNKLQTYQRKKESFTQNPKSILNLHCSQEDADVISHIYSIPHVTLKNRAEWALGIVTGNNKKFMESTAKPGLMPVMRGSNITKIGISKISHYIPSDLSLYQQVAPIKYFEAREKLIYKFISSRLCFFYDNQQHYVLNSVNMLIPYDDFPINKRMLCDLLNSDFMNWIFYKVFNTHKILRGDLEFLPIHKQFLTGSHFNELEFIENLNIRKLNNGTFRVKK